MRGWVERSKQLIKRAMTLSNSYTPDWFIGCEREGGVDRGLIG